MGTSSKLTRQSEIVSWAVARRATTSVDHLWCTVVLKIECVICTVLIITITIFSNVTGA